MAIFNNGGDKLNTKTTIIAEDIFIKGEIETSSVLYADGRIEGVIRSTNTVAIGKTGVVKGMTYADKVVINGSFEGNIEAESVEILNGGSLTGDILSSSLVIESGAAFNGKSTSKKSALNTPIKQPIAVKKSDDTDKS